MRDLPAFTGRAQVHGQGIGGFTVLHQFGGPFTLGQGERRQRDVVDATVEGDGNALLVA
ncbi:hypothetical protein D3C76_1624570 [compost metagenome]